MIIDHQCIATEEFSGNDGLKHFEMDHEVDRSSLLPEHQQTKRKSTAEFSEFKRPISLWPLVALIFYGVSGGPFGIEDAVAAAGPFLAIIGYLVFPLFWSIPEALITAELSCAFPEASGFVAWVDEAYGPYWGFVEGYLSWLSGVADNALYPILFVDYLQEFLEYVGWASEDGVLAHGGVARLPTVLGATLALTFLSWRGLDVVGWASIALAAATLLPFAVMALLGVALGKVNPGVWLATLPGGILGGAVRWRRYLNIIFWNLNYWDSAASFAGDVQNPSKTFPQGMVLAVFVVIIGIQVPLMVGLGSAKEDEDWSDWTDGHLTTAAARIGGAWLGGWVLLAAGGSAVGQFVAEMASDAFQLMGMAERGMLPAALGRRSRFGTPTLAYVLSASGVILLSAFSFLEVIEILNFLYCWAQLLEFAAFISLRRKRMDLHRPYKIPVGTLGATLLLVFPTVTVVIMIAWSSFKTWMVGGSFMIFGLLMPKLMKFLSFHGVFEFIPEEERIQSSKTDCETKENCGVSSTEERKNIIEDHQQEDQQPFLIINQNHKQQKSRDISYCPPTEVEESGNNS